MSRTPAIRPYHVADRPHIRRLCWETADQGRPGDELFWDRELFADLLTAGYTDSEPECVWSAVIDDTPVGYLTGTLDTATWQRRFFLRVALPACVRAVLRRAFWSRECWRFVALNLPLAWKSSRVSLASWPAHLHVNVDQGWRGHDLGRRLVEQFLDQARQHGRRGVHASVREDNPGGRTFFERMGFEPVVTLPMFHHPRTGTLLTRVIYARDLP